MPTAVVNDRVHYLLNSQANPLLCWAVAQREGGVSVLLSAEQKPTRAKYADLQGQRFQTCCRSIFMHFVSAFEVWSCLLMRLDISDIDLC